MEKEAIRDRATAVLSAWNDHDVDRVVACYTEDCVYRDPNTRGAVAGREALSRYLTRLFRDWRMHWSLREFFAFGDGGSRGTAVRDRRGGISHMNANRDRICITKRRRRPSAAGLALASAFILLASGASGMGSLAASATDLEKLDAKVAKSAITVGGFEKPKLPCVCEEGTTDDTLGAAGFLVRTSVGRFIEGVLQQSVTVACVVQGFDASGALHSTHGCTVFAVLPH